MADHQVPEGITTPDINAAIQARGLDFVLGIDTQRVWATGIQAFINPDVTMLVFREQNLAQSGPDNALTPVLKNVASIVIPTTVFQQFYDNAGATLASLNGLTDNAG